MISTYRSFSEKVVNAHYKGFPTPEAPITLRFIAERAATKVAKYAVRSAYGNSNANEATYANDQFISTFYNQPLLTDADTGEKYSVMAATPAGLPNMREVAQVSFSGAPDVHCVPMLNHMDFVENLLPSLPSGVALYKVENGRIVFKYLPAIISSGVNQKLVGAIPPGETLLDSLLNIPKNIEDDIFLEILQELAIDYKVPVNNLHNAVPE